MRLGEPDHAAALFNRLVDVVAEAYELSYQQAMRFIQEGCNAGGLPNPEEEPELVEQLREGARQEVDISWLT